MDQKRVIGSDGDLPWRLPDDLKTFRKMTLNRPIIMGRKTYESIGKPLPKRTNIILTRDPTFPAEGCLVANSINESLTMAVHNLQEEQEIIIGGGGIVYQLFLPYLTHMVLTFVDAEISGDTWFPEINGSLWKLDKRTHHPADERHQFSFDTVFYSRKK